MKHDQVVLSLTRMDRIFRMKNPLVGRTYPQVRTFFRFSVENGLLNPAYPVCPCDYHKLATA
jgi:hypothetical protein